MLAIRSRRVEAADQVPGLALIFLAFSALILSGCGTPAAPQPPSLKLPEPVADLTASRAGNEVMLHWTAPRKTTDHLLIHGSIPVTICRHEYPVQPCTQVGHVSVSPRAAGEFRDVLPSSLSQGSARELIYSVELSGSKGRSAGPSNSAIVLAGAAPGPVSGITSEVRADGVALHWDRNKGSDEATSVRLHRKLLTIPKKKAKNGVLEAEPEPVLRDLLAPPPAPAQQSGALDTSAHFGQSYEYTAQRIVQITVDQPAGKQTFELAGPISQPIKVDVIDIFPPAVPQELAAVFVPERHSIDLSWQPNTESDLAGYIAYRSVDGSQWIRISGPTLINGPAYRDATIERGHEYRYAISAIDQSGHESKRSAEASESTPAD